MSLGSGSRLGPYEIISHIGSGAMGDVWRAHDTRLGRDVALKVLPEAFACDADRLARFEREARSIAALNHPNIVVLYSVEEEAGVRFLTMELVEGEGLDRLVIPGGLPTPRVLDLCIAMCDALAAAHQKGVVHRDLKPANVKLTLDGRAKVLDFGLAKLGSSAGDLDATRAVTTASPISTPGQVIGTLPYMAPEQIRGGVVDARTDLFALGVILYELLTGLRPFSGTTWADVSSSILRDAPPPLTSMRPDLPPALARLVAQCLEKDPHDRLQTAHEVCSELRRLRGIPGPGASERPSTEGVASIAVLPFVNRSRDADDEYFSDGLADEILNLLAKIRGLRVAARSSAFSFKNRSVTVGEVGRALNVDAVLEGSVRKLGDRVRIAVDLVKTSDGYHLWSEIYDRTLDDIFEVQDDIAGSVVKELRAALLGGRSDSQASGEVREEVARAARGRGQNPEALGLYLQGHHLIDRGTRADVAKGIDYLVRALNLEPGNALVWAALGWTHAREADTGWVPPSEGYARAREAAQRALALEPALPEGHALLGWIQTNHDWDWIGAEASYRRSLELAPGNAVVLSGAGRLAYFIGHLDDAIHLCRSAVERDPLTSQTYNTLGRVLHAAGRLAEAEASYRKSLELAPQRVFTHANLAQVLLAQGDEARALVEARQEPLDWARLWALAIIHHVAGRGAESDEALHELTSRHAADVAYQIAEAHAVRGERDAAFEWLDRAHAQRDGGLSEMKCDPHLRSLRDDPRWEVFLRRMGLAT